LGNAEYSADENEIGVGDGVGPHDSVRLARTSHAQRWCDVLPRKSSHQEFIGDSSLPASIGDDAVPGAGVLRAASFKKRRRIGTGT
jgi:hypothetical protein